jgi:hypothetical protein
MKLGQVMKEMLNIQHPSCARCSQQLHYFAAMNFHCLQEVL